MSVRHMCDLSLRGQKRALDMLELELQKVVIHRGLLRVGPEPLKEQRMFLTTETSPAPPS